MGSTRWPVLALAIAAGTTGRVAAQGRPLSVSGAQVLDFGPVFPGVPGSVALSDPILAGRFNVMGARNAEVQLTFTLPAALAAPGGGSLPLQFTAANVRFDRALWW